MCFCQNLAAMNEVCEEIEEGSNHPIIINQTFADYKKERGEQPLMLLFPGGRTVVHAEDPRGKQQEHQGFYTIDIDDQCNSHLKGSIFSKKLWEEIEDNSLNLVHGEVPGPLSFFVVPIEHDLGVKQEFILRKINLKTKMGGRLFADLRYHKYWPEPNTDKPLDYAEGIKKIIELREEDPDFFVDVSYKFSDKQKASFWYSLLGGSQDEIYQLLQKCSSGLFSSKEEYEKYANLEEAAYKKIESLSEEELKKLQYPYIIFFDKKTRGHILNQHDAVLSQYGFKKVQVIEINGRFNRVAPISHPDVSFVTWGVQEFRAFGMPDYEGKGIYQGMCFIDNIAEYEKVEEVK